MRRPVLVLALIAAAMAAGCAKRTEPPGDPLICYHVVTKADGTLKYNVLVKAAPNLETCAANLEAMRIKFLRMGGSNRDILGAYQGNFLFLQREGVFTAPSLEAHQYLALVRTGDGRLAIPSAIAQ